MYNINWANQYEVMGVCLKDDNNNYGGISIRKPIISINEMKYVILIIYYENLYLLN